MIENSKNTEKLIGVSSLQKQIIRVSALRWIWLALLIIALDQLTKLLITTSLQYASVVRVNAFFNLTLFYNTGAAFSFLENYSLWSSWLFASFAVIVSVAILLWLRRLPANEYVQAIALNLILGGALGNLLDRIIRGHVIDFIQWHAQNWYWPAFNVADSAICVGAVLLGWKILLTKN